MKKLKIGLLFTSQDRYELMRLSLSTAIAGVNLQKYSLTILWLDGSIENDAKNFFKKIEFNDVRLIKKSGYRNIGPANVAQIGMNELTKVDKFDWIGMFESDCYFFEDWFDSCMTTLYFAEKDKKKVGIISPFSIKTWSLIKNKNYIISEITSATCSLFKINTWKSMVPASIAHPFRKLLINKLSSIPSVHPSIDLGWDWLFSLAAYHQNNELTIMTPKTKLLNCGNSDIVKNIPPNIIYNDKFDDAKDKNNSKIISRNKILWNEVVIKMYDLSDISILKASEINIFSFLYVKYDKSWYFKEYNNSSWWRWSGKKSEIIITNTSDESIYIDLNLELMILDRAQIIILKFNKKKIAELSLNKYKLKLKIELKKGPNTLIFNPKIAGKKYPSDNRILSYAIKHNY